MKCIVSQKKKEIVDMAEGESLGKGSGTVI